MLVGLLVLLVALVPLAVAFVGARFLMAPAGPRRLMCALGAERDAWAGVSFGRRALFVLSGPLGFYLVMALFGTAGYLYGGRNISDERSMRVFVAPDGPGARAGLQNGDRIVSVNGAPAPDWDTLKRLVAAHPGEPITLAAERDGAPLTVVVTPGPTGKILVGPPVEQQRVGVGEALTNGFADPPRIWAIAVRGFLRMFAGHESTEMSGPVGIVHETSKATQSGYVPALRFVVLLAAYFFWIPVLFAFVTFPRKRTVLGRVG